MSRHREKARRRGAVGVVVRAGKLLVIRRSQFVVAPGRYCFPGGAIEAAESEEEALVREIREELNVEIRPQRRIWRSVTPWNVELAWWLGQLADGAEPVPNQAEVESVHWYTPAGMTRLAGLLESNLAFLDALSAGEVSLNPPE
ncbi:MAG: NUDIX domain-containing protein [Pirellulales bacterium]|nr:NUDIX domain-containing protein [Pirellulales bacterium]